jgi:uncharacterized protein YfdQ (DUF2303 family)
MRRQQRTIKTKTNKWVQRINRFEFSCTTSKGLNSEEVLANLRKFVEEEKEKPTPIICYHYPEYRWLIERKLVDVVLVR